MTFFVENETDSDFGFDHEDLIKTVCEKTFSEEKAPVDHLSVGVTITDSEGIRELNKEFRGIDSATDVLSFPNLDFDSPSDFDIPDEKKVLYTDPDTGDILMGEIVLNADRVFSQAEEYGHSTKREMAFLVVHSCLHLCGYDHMTEEEEKIMFSRQEEILNQLGILRETDQA